MTAIGVWARADWRTRPRSLLALVLLAGAVGGVAMTATAGARRTASTLDRFAAAAGTSDALVDVGGGGAETAREIASLPSVEQASAVTLVFAVLDGVETDFALLVPVDEAVGSTIESDLLIHGRPPDPGRADEVLIDETTARLLSAGVGDELQIGTLTPEQVAAERYGSPEGPMLDVRVTGISRGVEDLIGREDGLLRGTPAMQQVIAGAADEVTTYVAVRLRSGTVSDLEDELAELGATSDAPFNVISFETRAAAARRTVSALAIGLAAFAVAAAATALVVVGQAVARHVHGAAGDDGAVRALGMTPRQRVLGLASTALPVAVAAPLVAVAASVVGSALTPIGLARRAEPDPGVRIDMPVLLLGALAVAVVTAGAAIAAAGWITRRSRTAAITTPSAAARVAARAGAGPSFVNGAALALARRIAGAPVRSTLAALTVAVAGTAAVATYDASSDRLVTDSARWGSPWDLSLDFTSAQVDAAGRALADDESFTAVARWDSGQALVEDSPVRVHGIEPLRGEVGFSLVEGRQPRHGEVVIGAATADREELQVGDMVTVSGPDGAGRAKALRVVGLAVFPDIDEGDLDDAVGMTAADFAVHATVPDLYEASQVVVQIADGVSLTGEIERLRSQFGDALLEPLPVRPGVIGNLSGIRSIPRALLGFMAILGAASLAHAVRSTVRRRAAHFATLRAIGMTGRQLLACSVTMALVLTLIALAAGLPLGLAAGRLTWRAVAGDIGVADDPLIPAGAVALTIVCSVAVAVAVGASLGRPSHAVTAVELRQ